MRCASSCSSSKAPRPRLSNKSSSPPEPAREVGAVERSAEKALLLAPLEVELLEGRRSREEEGPTSQALKASAQSSSPLTGSDMAESWELTRSRAKGLFDEGKARELCAELEDVEVERRGVSEKRGAMGGRGKARRLIVPERASKDGSEPLVVTQRKPKGGGGRAPGCGRERGRVGAFEWFDVLLWWCSVCKCAS